MMEIQPVTLFGRIIRLVPLSETHLPDLSLVGLDENIWRYMVYGNIRTASDLRAWVKDLMERQSHGTDLPFAVISLAIERAIGVTRYLNICSEDRGLEIGGTWYGVAYQGTGINTEAKYLLLKHAFEVLRCLRVQLKTDLRNTRSQRAIEKLGAVREGILRKHMILDDGFVRDSVLYSITDDEWPEAKSRLEMQMSR